MPSTGSSYSLGGQSANGGGSAGDNRRRRRSRVFQSQALPLSLPARLPGAAIVAYPPARRTPSLIASAQTIPLGFGAPLPLPDQPATVSFFQVGSGTCTGCSCCSKFIVACNGVGVAGATVTVSTLLGVTVTSGITDSTGSVTLCYIKQGKYLVSATGTGHNDIINQTTTLVCGQPVTLGVCLQCAVYVLECNTIPVAGVAISITPVGGGAMTTGTTGPNGCALVPVSSYLISYTITATWNGQTASAVWNGSGFRGQCGILDAGFGIVKFTVLGCAGLPLEGAIVDLNGISQVTDVNGMITGYLLAPGNNCAAQSYSWTITDAANNFEPLTGTTNIFCGNAPNLYMACPCETVVMTPAVGFDCFCNQTWNSPKCNTPLPVLLTLSDSIWGEVDLIDVGGGLWEGTLSVPFPAYCDCPAGEPEILYQFSLNPMGVDACKLTVSYGCDHLAKTTPCDAICGAAVFPTTCCPDGFTNVIALVVNPTKFSCSPFLYEGMGFTIPCGKCGPFFGVEYPFCQSSNPWSPYGAPTFTITE